MAFPASIPPADRWLVIIAAYLDESGTHAGSKAACVAGYLATTEAWLRFEVAWKAELQRHGLPFFHMTDFANGARQFKGIDKDAKRALFSKMVSIIESHVSCSVGMVIPAREFSECFSEESKQLVGGAYGLAAHSCYFIAAQWIQKYWSDGWIAYVMESGARGAGAVVDQYQRSKRDPESLEFSRAVSLRLEDKKLFVPLQAADILAYELYRHYPRRAGIIEQLPRNELRMLRFGECIWEVMDKGHMRRWNNILEEKSRQLKEESDRKAKKKAKKKKP